MKIHLIGIGGIGISALAQYYLAKNNQVSGSDLCSSEITELLKSKGADIFIGANKEENISKDLDLVIYSPAIEKDNPELKKAIGLGINTASYPEALGKITEKYFTIAVSGAHGKSTTTSMISIILARAGLNPTVFLGTKLKEFGNSNFRLGGQIDDNLKNLNFKFCDSKSKILVIEADEYKSSFLNYFPEIIVLTNIEEEHLDYYGSLDNILEVFEQYILRLPDNGYLIYNSDDKNISKLDFSQKSFTKIGYSNKDKEIEDIRKVLKVPGLHNASNALAAFKAVRALGLNENEILSGLSDYCGAWRRFEIKNVSLNQKDIILVSDYAHHPTEIEATLKAAREKWENKKIWAVFQPHQKQRTSFLFDKIVDSFAKSSVDKVILLPIYDVAGRDNKEIQDNISSEKLCEEINKKGKSALYIENFIKAREFLIDNLENGDILFIMGAGDIYDLDKMLST
ncbi:UDP-N-acetylmuramate--L-alanine ligase [Patescibacteria group bacterium]|nr:UDP-N-acetylmuramate--L-alanine ligase [Patescibacteria group bacterium]MBU4023248.1 UDP-N-acetylmuramate--L-alanine ligase [Patescibacteria group bacterium]MBU4078074.1 UDP-N-acetylmuramate--L-alanine ligase [Patescibacteria group bacterium]